MVEPCPGARFCRECCSDSWPELLREVLGHACQLLSASWCSSAKLSPAFRPGAPFLVAGEGSLSGMCRPKAGMCPMPCRSTGICRVSVVPRAWIGRVRSSACSQVSVWGSQRCPQSPCPLQIWAVIL